MSSRTIEAISASAIGLLFGLDIAVPGMGNPAKVLAFFDVAGAWNPSLAFVIAGAVVVTAIGYRFVPAPSRTAARSTFQCAGGQHDRRAACAGFGRLRDRLGGGTGFCPGGVVPMLGLGRLEPVLFFLGFLVGIAATRQLRSMRARAEAAATASSAPSR